MTSAQVLTLVALGAFHGLHPGMGWMLATARGLQEGGRGAVLRALPPIAAGHAVSVAAAAVAITVTGSLTASVLFPVVGGGVIVVVGLVMLLWRRHAHRTEIRLPPWQLAAWSFVMASAHGAGLMLMPVLAGRTSHEGMGHGGGHAGHGAAAGGDADGPGTGADAPGTSAPDVAPGQVWDLWDATVTGLFAAGVHTAAMLAACAAAALIAHDFLGVRALGWKGVTMDRIWAATLLVGGLFVLWSVR